MSLSSWKPQRMMLTHWADDNGILELQVTLRELDGVEQLGGLNAFRQNLPRHGARRRVAVDCRLEAAQLKSQRLVARPLWLLLA